MIFKMNIYLILLSFFVFITIPFKSYSLDTKSEQAVVIEFDTNVSTTLEAGDFIA